MSEAEHPGWDRWVRGGGDTRPDRSVGVGKAGRRLGGGQGGGRGHQVGWDQVLPEQLSHSTSGPGGGAARLPGKNGVFEENRVSFMLVTGLGGLK